MRYIYVSGPYTHGDQAANVRAAIEAANVLLDAGYIPYCPHLSHFHHMLSRMTTERGCNLASRGWRCANSGCEAPGYSPGADREVGRGGE